MKFQQTLTLEDFREFHANGLKKIKRTNPYRQSLPRLLLLVVSVVCALPAFYSRSGYQPKELGLFAEQNLWVTLAPSLCMSTYFTMAIVVSPMMARMKKTTGTKTPTSYRLLVRMISWLPYVWLVPAMASSLAIRWTPSDGQALWAAFAPWTLYFTISGFATARRVNRSIEKAWDKKPSLQRANMIGVTPDEIESDDGVVSTRYRWSHFKHYGETENLLLIKTVTDLTVLLSKKAVPDEQSMDELKMLIHNNIANGEFTVKPTGFQVILPAEEIAGSK